VTKPKLASSLNDKGLAETTENPSSKYEWNIESYGFESFGIRIQNQNFFENLDSK